MRYAVVNSETNIVENVIELDDGSDWPTPDGCYLVLAPTASPGDSYVNGEFVSPPPPPLTEAELLAIQSQKLQGLSQIATAQKTALTNRIGTLNDAIELEMATPEEEAELPVRTLQLKAWKTYAILLGRVTTQTGWYSTVTWPVQPTEGMDLTVSAVAKPVQAS
jgi:hypothetical protein